MSVAFFQHMKSGCFWYRIKHPKDVLEKAGIKTHFISINEEVTDEVMNEITTFQVYGAVPFSMSPTFEYLKKNGKKIVYDADDALDLVDVTNPFYKSVQRDLGSANEALLYADEVTVSTPEMKTYMEGKFKGKITVVPNCYIESEWQYPRPKRDGIRIGYSGSPTHVSDLIEVLPAIKNLQKKYDIRFLIQGFSRSDYGQWFKDHRFVSTKEGTDELNTLDKMLSEIKFEWVPNVDFDNYPDTLTNMSIDIGLCPLKDTPFNRCRSASKALEYNLTGAMVMASDIVTYRNDPTSILVKPHEWEEQIEYYITNEVIRRKVHFEHMDWVRSNRNIDDKIELLKSIYVV